MSPESKEIPDCYLCLKRKASARKSHFTSATATEHVFGARNAEEIHSINPKEVKLETFWGRNNKKNTDPEVKKQTNTEGFVFCKECEENLSRIEGLITPHLKDGVIELVAGIDIYKRTARFQRYFEIIVHPKIFATYLYSVIWRQHFQQEYSGHDSVLPTRRRVKLREALAVLLELPESGITSSELFELLPNVVCYTAVHSGENRDAVNPTPRPPIPNSFIWEPTIVFFFWKAKYLRDLRRPLACHYSPQTMTYSSIRPKVLGSCSLPKRVKNKRYSGKIGLQHL